MEKQADRNLVKFSKEKCKVLHLGRNNPRYQYMLGSDQLESSFAEKALGVLLDDELIMNQECALAAKKPVIPWAALGGVLPAGQGW